MNEELYGDNIAIFGGAFDPITFGHMVAAMAVYAKTGYLTWMMPCYQHQLQKQPIDPNHRFAMCRLVTDILGDNFKTSNYEIRNKFQGSTYDLLKLLKEQFKHTKFHLVIGSDNLDSLFKTWHQGAELAKENNLIVIHRPGSPLIVDDWKDRIPNAIWIHSVGYPSASSDFRQAMQEKNYKLAKRFVLPCVWEYITYHDLYKNFNKD